MSMKSALLLTKSFKLIVLFTCSSLVLPGSLLLIPSSDSPKRAFREVPLKLEEIIPQSWILPSTACRRVNLKENNQLSLALKTTLMPAT